MYLKIKSPPKIVFNIEFIRKGKRKMKITKYNQSCMIVETNNKRILIDPGIFGYNEEILNQEWTNIDIILVTHKHADHCNKEAIDSIIIRDNAKLYITKEIQDTYNFEKMNVIKEGDIIEFQEIKIEVVHAIHGYLTGMRERNAEVLENVGYIINDGKNKFYTTSDTINFYNQIKCDIIAMPFNGNGLTMGLIDGIEFIKAINPKLVLPIHMEHPNPEMNPDIEKLKSRLKEKGIENKILKLKESIEIN